MNALEKQMIETCEALEKAKLISQLYKSAIITDNMDVMRFVNNFVKENE